MPGKDPKGVALALLLWRQQTLGPDYKAKLFCNVCHDTVPTDWELHFTVECP